MPSRPRLARHPTDATLATTIPTRAISKYLEEWERESKASQDWRRVPSKSADVVSAQTLEELRGVERELAEVTTVVSGLTFRVASSRETGRPPGYVHGP
jgi:hypothetical protein